tara:strand:+ start:319 stop:522 length:204 start_codon:yes stop_codon:yes gene_type:complete
VLLLDVHGLKMYADFVTVGTRNRTSASFSGASSVEGDHSGFLWQLRQLLGTAVQPGVGQADIVRYVG